jgi:hypothetical protein
VTIEFICNNPYGKEWKIIPLECSERYHTEILLKEVQSWMQKELGIPLNELTLKYWHIWDEEGLVDPMKSRDPRDGERFAVLLQDQRRDIDIEDLRVFIEQFPCGGGDNTSETHLLSAPPGLLAHE